MTDKQYADMTTIMMFCRHYADQMYKCLEDAGLIEQGFELNIRVGDLKLFSGKTEKCCIELEQDIMTNTANYYKNRMAQRRMNEERWFVDADPKAEEGSVPPMVGLRKNDENVCKGSGNSANKPYPVDGLWLSSRDDYSDVGVW